MNYKIEAIRALAKGKYLNCDELGNVVWKEDAIDVPTSEEIVAKAIELETKFEIDSQRKVFNDARAELLDEGALTQDGRLWFNEEVAMMFLQKATSHKAINEGIADENKTMFRWRDKDRLEIVLTPEELILYSKEIIETLDKIYLDML